MVGFVEVGGLVGVLVVDIFFFVVDLLACLQLLVRHAVGLLVVYLSGLGLGFGLGLDLDLDLDLLVLLLVLLVPLDLFLPSPFLTLPQVPLDHKSPFAEKY